MGLDMFAHKTRERISMETDFLVEMSEGIEYWQNHDLLNQWMMNLYDMKGGNNSDTTVMLDEDDLDELEETLLAGDLPFFRSRGNEAAALPKDLNFVRLAREALAEGYTVFYFSG